MSRARLRMAHAVLRPRRRPAVVPEAVEQSRILQLIGALGGTPYVSGTRRSRGQYCPSCHAFVPNTDHGTHQTPGIADVECFLPRRLGPRAGTWAFVKVECKREGGRMSDDQLAYRDFCLKADVHHVVGGYDAFLAWCIAEDFLHRDSVPHYRQPPATEPRS